MADSTTLEAFYRIEGATARPSIHTRGPWDPNAQHGGAPTALIAHVVNETPSAVPMRVSRLTVDLFRPVPIAPITISKEIIREGRNIQVLDVRLSADGKECVRASALRIRAADVQPPDDVRPPKQRWKRPGDSQPIGDFAREGLAQSMDIRAADARFRDKNAPPVWFRLKRPFVEGVEITPLMRASIVADFCNGMSGVLDWNLWTFINADLTVHFAREPVGEWIMLEAQGWISTEGRGAAFGVLSDLDGAFGRATQSLVIAPR